MSLDPLDPDMDDSESDFESSGERKDGFPSDQIEIDFPDVGTANDFDESQFDHDFDDDFEEEIEGEYELEDDQYGDEFNEEFGHLTTIEDEDPFCDDE